MEPRQFCVILRGPAGAGKSSLAREVQRLCSSKTAVIDTDLFNWTIVPGEDDKAVVYENVVWLAGNYLRHAYNVIIEGLILSSEERGALEPLRELARHRPASVVDFYCWVPEDEALRRNEGRDKGVNAEQIREWWELAEADRARIQESTIELDMTDPPETLAQRVFSVLAGQG